MADERLESGAESGRGDDRVRPQPGPVFQPNAVGVDRGHPGDDLHAPALDRLDDIRIHDRGLRVVSAKGGKGSLPRDVEPVVSEIANGLAPDERVDGVRYPRRQSLQRRRQQVVWAPGRGAQNDVRRRANRQSHLSGPALGEVAGDFHAGTTAPDDDHVLALELARVAVLGRVEQAAGKAVMPRPARQLGDAPMPGGDDDLAGRPLPGRRGQPPAVRESVDSVHPDAEAHLQVVLGDVRLQVANEFVSGRKGRGPFLEAAEPQRYVPPARVHPQPVIPLPPRGGDALSGLEDFGWHAQLTKPGRSGQPCGSGPDDHHHRGGRVGSG